MTGSGPNRGWLLEPTTAWITDRPVSIVAVFLVLTALFALGLPFLEFDPGEEGFTEGTPEMDALEAVNEEFEDPFTADERSTQVVQRGENVVSREGVLRMLQVQHRLETNPDFRVSETSSPAGAIALAIDPSATTREEQIRAVESVTDAEVRQAVRWVAENRPGVTQSLSEDFNPEAAHASATIAVVDHEIPTGDEDEFHTVQHQVIPVVDSVDGDVFAFGSAIFEAEFEDALSDSLQLMVPAVILLILLFLLFAYRDPIDFVLGLFALLMASVWTFGFMGHARIPFNQIMIAIPSLLLAIGIDFGIHTVNRYREERVTGSTIHAGMTVAMRQLLVAFFIVATISAIGFGANMISDLGPIFDFGFVSAIGIAFTFLIFGIFMPAAKVALDDRRDRWGVPEFGTAPLGAEDSRMGRILPVGARVARNAPAVMLVVILLATAGAGYVGTDVDTHFDDEDFLPYEEPPAHLEILPEPVGPGEYEVRTIVSYLSDTFETGEDDEITVYIEGSITDGYVLESVHRAGEEPPSAIVTEGRHADAESIIDVIEVYAQEDEEFAQLVERSDTTGDGVPNRNLNLIYDRLLDSPHAEWAAEYLAEDRRSMRVIYSVDAEASQEEITVDAREVADRQQLEATATGTVVIFHTVTELLLESAILSLSLALLLTAIFLFVMYKLLEGRGFLGIATMVPIAVAVTFLAATMVVLDIPFNAVTATVLAITIGIGIDYSVHLTHRFADEYAHSGQAYPSLVTTLQGTGGGITGSMVTTVGGVGSLLLAVTPMMAEFGILMVISVVYSYLAAIIVLPPTILVWDRYFGDG